MVGFEVWSVGDRVVRRSYIIYINGSSRVVSFKLPENALYLLDKYSNILGFKNRSDLLRLLITVFIKSMEMLERECGTVPRGIKIGFVVRSSDGTKIKHEIDLEALPKMKEITSYVEIERSTAET